MTKCVLSVILAGALGCIPLQAELVHHWTLDETNTTQGTTITDVVGGLNGSVSGTGVTPAVGVHDGAIHFAGEANDHIAIPGFSTTGLKNVTVTFWVNMDVGTIASLANGDYQRVFSAHDGFEAMIQADGSADTGKLGNNFFKTGGKAGYALSLEPLAEGEWVHVAMTSSLSTAGGDGLMAIYINGIFDNSRANAATVDWAGGEMRIAHRGAGAADDNHYSGLIDDIRVYNTILTDEEILALVPQPSVSVTGFEKAGENLIITWDGEVGTGYNVLTSDDLTVPPPDGLALLDPFTNLAGVAGPMSVTTMIESAAAEMIYGVERFKIILPPVFTDDFESGVGEWAASTEVGTTAWELGTPNYTSDLLDVFTTAFSGTNAWATGLTLDYEAFDHLRLRSPVIDLSGLPRAALTFYEVKDIEQENNTTGYDHGYINILDAGGATLATNLYDSFGTSTNWTRQDVDLSAFTNQQIIIEFEFVSDQYKFSDQFGWAIDDVSVGADPAPEPPPPPIEPIDAQISSIVMVKTQPSTEDIFNIVEGSVINLDTLGVAVSNVNIRAETDMPVGSVRFNLNAGQHIQTESVAPYYLGGDAAGVAEDLTLPIGTNTLVVTPYELGGGGGGTGVVKTVTFTLIATP